LCGGKKGKGELDRIGGGNGSNAATKKKGLLSIVYPRCRSGDPGEDVGDPEISIAFKKGKSFRRTKKQAFLIGLPGVSSLRGM